MMRLVLRGLCKASFHLARLLLTPLELLAPRVYMRIYLRMLSALGVRFTGCPRYISSRAIFDDFRLVCFGERVVVSKYVLFLTHDYSVTTALIAIDDPPVADVSVNQEIRVGANVFIGISSILMPGTVIEDNVIIGAGSVVRGLVARDSIVIGNPAQKVGSITEKSESWLRKARGPLAVMDRR